MNRIQAQSKKFGSVEVAMRVTLRRFTEVTEQFDKALAGKRTPAETALLQSIKSEWVELHKQAQKLVLRLFDEAERV